MTKKKVLGSVWGFLVYSLLFQACTTLQTNRPQTEPKNTPPSVIDAQPLQKNPVPDIVALNATAFPWLQSTFLSSLQGQNVSDLAQGLWVQSSTQAYASHQASTPLSAASVTKVATTLAALQQLGPEFRFETRWGQTGELNNGVLKGDLIVAGGNDPFFVWEDAFAIAAMLERQGIQQVAGDLVIHAPFVMNFEAEDPQLSGSLLLQALNADLWANEAIAQFEALPAGTPKPKVSVQGSVRIVTESPANVTWKISHQSLPLVELLKRMNRYSNNPMAEQIANHVGGALKVTRIVRSLTGLEAEAVNFINGSGLGAENRITPQGATLMLQALSNLLQSKGMSLGDVLTIVGQDEGILDPRPLPDGLVVKSGTLDQVSALAGVLPTEREGPIWFTMLNTQGDVEKFRQAQEQLLQSMVDNWGLANGDKLLTPTLDAKQLQTINRRL